jgi:hypothetical protein
MSQPPYPRQQEPRFVPNSVQGYPPPNHGGQFYGGPGYGGPPPEPPRKKRHWVRNIFFGFCGFIVLIVIIGVATSHSNSGPSVAASPDSTSAASHAASPQATHAAAPAAAAKPQTLLDISGSGDQNTARYTVGGSGNYDIYWSYNEGNMGSSVNFDFEGDGSSDFNVTGPNQLGTGGSGVAHVYNDAGQHYLQIISEGNWTIKVVTVP